MTGGLTSRRDIASPILSTILLIPLPVLILIPLGVLPLRRTICERPALLEAWAWIVSPRSDSEDGDAAFGIVAHNGWRVAVLGPANATGRPFPVVDRQIDLVANRISGDRMRAYGRD